MSFIKKIWSLISSAFTLGNSLNDIRLGFEPELGKVANFAEGYTYKFRDKNYHVGDNRWALA